MIKFIYSLDYTANLKFYKLFPNYMAS